LAIEPTTPAEQRVRLHSRIALASEDTRQVPKLIEALLSTELSYVGVLRDSLAGGEGELTADLWSTLHDSSAPSAHRFRAALALATYATKSNQWSAADIHFVVQQLVVANPVDQPCLWEYLGPLADRLIPDLEQVFHDQQLPESHLIAAANALAVFARDESPRLVRLLAAATPAQYAILYPLVSNRADETGKAMLCQTVGGHPAETLSQADRVALGQRRAGAAISLLRLGEAEKSLGAFQIQEDPESLSQFVHRARARDVTANQLVRLLRLATDVHSRFAILLTLGDYPLAEVDPAQRDGLIMELVEAYRNDPSSAIHGATGWLLRK
jgi:hypothetical protein